MSGICVTFRMTITNTSAITAYDVVAGDAVPAGLSYVPGSIRIDSGPMGTTDASGAPNLAWRFAAIPPGAVAVVAFDAQINGSGPLSIVNTANLTWTSTAGSNADERTGAGGPLNDYNTSAQATLSDSVLPDQQEAGWSCFGLGGRRRHGALQHHRHKYRRDDPGDGAADRYLQRERYLQFLSASTAPNSTAAGLLTWNNIGPLAPGAVRTITVDFTGHWRQRSASPAT